MPAAPDDEARASSGGVRCPIATQPGPGDPADRFSVLLGSGAQPGGAGGLDFADLTGSVQQLLDDREAMGALRRYLDEGRGLRPALEATAGTVPTAAPGDRAAAREPRARRRPGRHARRPLSPAVEHRHPAKAARARSRCPASSESLLGGAR